MAQCLLGGFVKKVRLYSLRIFGSYTGFACRQITLLCNSGCVRVIA